jgi:predicted metalloprotease
MFGGPEGVQPEQDGFSATVTPELRATFTEIDNYWEQTRGLGETGIKLVMVEDGDEFICHGDKNVTIEAYHGSAGSYCTDGKTIVIARETWESDQKTYAKAGGDPTEYSKLLLGHEYGHGLRQLDLERAGLKETDVRPAPSREVEQQADCIDGIAMKGLHATIVSADAWFDMVGDNPSFSNSPDAHGSAAERKQAYINGQSHVDGDMLNCGLAMLPMGS